MLRPNWRYRAGDFTQVPGARSDERSRNVSPANPAGPRPSQSGDIIPTCRSLFSLILGLFRGILEGLGECRVRQNAPVAWVLGPPPMNIPTQGNTGLERGTRLGLTAERF